jgi:serine/threonine protein kinase
MALVPGTKLGPYEIQSPLGAGGVGEVTLAADTDRLPRFEREARSVAALNLPNIVAVHDIGTYDGAPYMACELLEGATLRERLRSGVLRHGKRLK